jgi:hypothetical protein
MKSKYYRIPALLVLMLIAATNARATTSVLQLKVEGNATCSSLATNAILQAKDTTYAPGATGFDSATGPDGQVFSYRISPANTISTWSIVNPLPSSGTAKPVNFIILKQAGSEGGRVFFYGSAGVNEDTLISTPNNITTVSFCYGLTPPIPTATLPTCDSAGLGNLADVCAADPTRIVTIFDESTPNWRVQTCSCNSDPLNQFTECNPALQAGTPGACTNSDGALQFLPIEVQLGRDPDSYYCTVINGTRKCYKK